MIIRGFQQVIALSCLALFLANCGGGPKEVEEYIPEVDPMTNLGIGPVRSLELGELDQAMADEGKKIYDAKCTACHNINTKMIGPPQAGVLDRRTPEWVMNMIVNPSEMIKKDPTARRLLKEYNNVPMTEQGVTEEEARKILEYFRTM
jgi:mono/diheme cytochrome c family protein